MTACQLEFEIACAAMTLPLVDMLKGENPLLKTSEPKAVSLDAIGQSVFKREIPTKRKFQDLRRKDSAVKAVKDLERDGFELYGLTKGQFSLTDLIEAIIEKTGPAQLDISTWTAAQTDVGRMLEFLGSGKVTGCRWLVDMSFVRRCPALVATIRREFGDGSLRVTRTHAKFVTITNDDWQVALRSSMNLNQNPRLESFEVGHDPELCGFLSGVFDDVFKRQKRALADCSTVEISRWFNAKG